MQEIITLTRLFIENILPDSTAAPGLLASQKEVSVRNGHHSVLHEENPRLCQMLMTLSDKQLQKHMLGDKLNDKISHRPTPDTLLKEGVLHEDPRSPDEKYEEAIEEEYAKREGGA